MEAPTVDLGITFSEEKGDSKQILIEVQERMARTEKALVKCGDTINDQTRAMSEFNSSLNDLGFKLKNLTNERNNNANGRGKPSYRNNNNRNRDRKRISPYNPDVTCGRCESQGHIEQDCVRQ